MSTWHSVQTLDLTTLRTLPQPRAGRWLICRSLVARLWALLRGWR